MIVRTPVAAVSDAESSAAPARHASDPRRIDLKVLARRFFARALNPRYLWQAWRMQRSRQSYRPRDDDAQLSLYAQMLPADFLHYGYFDDPERLGDDISLSDLACAQERYAELLLEHSGDSALPALDVGCGMGGLSRMLRDRGYTPVALTPDRSQAVYVSQRLPGVQVIRSKLEDLPAAEHAGRYGTIFTAESLQYLRLDRALPILAKILAPGGRWVACDYFRTQRGREKSGHLLEEFTAKLDQHGWRIAAQRDITPHVLPTLRFAHMWAERFGIPLMQFAFQRIRRKHPGLRHLLKDVLETLENAAHANVSLIHPHEFAANKRYQHLTLERTA